MNESRIPILQGHHVFIHAQPLENGGPAASIAGGSHQYTSATAPAAAGQLGSSLAITFSGSGQFYQNAVFTTASNNVGLVAWVQPALLDSGNHTIAYNGDATANGALHRHRRL